MRTALATLLLLSALALQARSEQPEFLYCRAAVDCSAAGGKVEVLPRDTFLIAFNSELPWLGSERASVIANVNGLLTHYGFPVKAVEVSLSEAKRIRDLPLADVALNYRANSYLATVGAMSDHVTLGGTDVHAVRRDDVLGAVVLGPTKHSHIEQIAVNPTHHLADPQVPPRRKRAILAVILVHEFVHAAHTRLLGTLVSGDPAPDLKPRRLVPIQTAVSATMKAYGMLAISRRTGHMADGLMAAGGEHSSSPDEEFGGSNEDVLHCLSDPRLPEAELGSLAKLAGSSRVCTNSNFPVSDYLRLPAANRSLIRRYLTKMSGAGCYAACYYDQLTEKAAMSASGYDSSKDPNFTLAGQLAPGNAPRKTWWQQVNARP